VEPAQKAQYGAERGVRILLGGEVAYSGQNDEARVGKVLRQSVSEVCPDDPVFGTPHEKDRDVDLRQADRDSFGLSEVQAPGSLQEGATAPGVLEGVSVPLDQFGVDAVTSAHDASNPDSHGHPGRGARHECFSDPGHASQGEVAGQGLRVDCATHQDQRSNVGAVGIVP